MKKLIVFLLSVMLVISFAVPALAATEPVITQQPQNPIYGEYGTATYSVTVYGEYLRCSWYMHFNGADYKISDTSGGIGPWEAYAGESYGAEEYTDGKYTTFTYNFYGIGKELDGCYLYAVIDDGHFEITSDKAYISVWEDAWTPPKTNVPVGMELFKGDVADLYCQASAVDGSELTYLWYESSTGDLRDITAVNRGTEDSDTLRVDTSYCGTRYYVCAVTTADGGMAYTSVVPITVIENVVAADPPEITTQTLQAATVGQSYSVKLSCTDADAVFTIYEDPGKDNDFKNTGLSLTQHGEIEGTPAKAGTYSFTVCAAGEGGEGYMRYTLTVNAPVVETTQPEETNDSAEPIEPEEPEQTQPGEDKEETTGQEAVTEDSEKPTEEPETETVADENEEESPKGMPWWGIILIAVAAAAIGVGGTVFILNKKK